MTFTGLRNLPRPATPLAPDPPHPSLPKYPSTPSTPKPQPATSLCPPSPPPTPLARRAQTGYFVTRGQQSPSRNPVAVTPTGTQHHGCGNHGVRPGAFRCRSWAANRVKGYVSGWVLGLGLRLGRVGADGWLSGLCGYALRWPVGGGLAALLGPGDGAGDGLRAAASLLARQGARHRGEEVLSTARIGGDLTQHHGSV
jgi:hypothetical protein